MNTFKNVQNYAFRVARSIGYLTYIACVVHCVLEYIGDLVISEGPSMEPTIFSENIMITEHISVRKQKFNRGDIVISKSPSNPKQYICKRVKALPGDKVQAGYFYETKIPKGHVWLEGDNKSNSSDSRNYGPVPQGLIRGRVVFIIWPFNRFRNLTKYEEQST